MANKEIEGSNEPNNVKELRKKIVLMFMMSSLSKLIDNAASHPTEPLSKIPIEPITFIKDICRSAYRKPTDSTELFLKIVGFDIRKTNGAVSDDEGKKAVKTLTDAGFELLTGQINDSELYKKAIAKKKEIAAAKLKGIELEDTGSGKTSILGLYLKLEAPGGEQYPLEDLRILYSEIFDLGLAQRRKAPPNEKPRGWKGREEKIVEAAIEGKTPREIAGDFRCSLSEVTDKILKHKREIEQKKSNNKLG